MSDQEKNSDFDSMSLVVFLWKWRKPLLIVTLLAAITSAGLSFLIQETYMSTAIIFPAKSNTVTLSENQTQNESPLQIGTEEEAEQLIQILNSAEIRDSIVQWFDLMKHYGIDESSPIKNYLLAQQYVQNITFDKTPYGSITIEVLDHEPKVAADIANSIVMLVDTVKNRMLRERAQEALILIEIKLQKVIDDVNMLSDTINALGRMGVVPPSALGPLTEGLATAKDAATREELRRKVLINETYGPLFSDLLDQRELKRTRLAELEKRHEQALLDANLKMSQKLELERAAPSERKTYPIRWLIVLIATLGSFIAAVLIIITSEKIKELRSKSIA
jgi:uncharacterized protein involved in exopolysaccharide biosynthesis